MLKLMDQKSDQTQPNTPAASQATDEKVLKDTEASLGWKSHVNSAAPMRHTKRRFLMRPKILVPISLAIIIALVTGVLIFLSQRKPAQPESRAELSLQSLGGDAVKSIVQAFSGGSKQVLTVSAETIFQNATTFEKDVKIDGLLTAAKGLNVSGASQMDTLNLRSDLTVGGGSTLQGAVDIRNRLNVNGAVTVSGSQTITGSLSVSGGGTFGGGLNVTGTLSASSLNVRSATVNDTLKVEGHIITDGSNPGVSTTSRLGNGGSASAQGNDTAGTLIINTGSNPQAGQLVTVNFKKSFGKVPKVLLSPVGGESARIQISSIRTPQFFSVSSNLAPNPNTQYAYDYFVIE